MARQASRKTVKKSPSKAVAIQTLTTPGVGGRRAFVARATKETRIAAAINLDGTGKYDIKTGIGFLDHMLEQLSRHSLIEARKKARIAIMNAMDAMRDMAPHGRDYIGNANALASDAAIFSGRMMALRQMEEDILSEALALFGTD